MVKEIRYEVVGWIQLAQDLIQWRNSVYIITKLCVPQSRYIYSSAE
jgi:hypothetical protein